jgi:hypothetical protein
MGKNLCFQSRDGVEFWIFDAACLLSHDSQPIVREMQLKSVLLAPNLFNILCCLRRDREKP